MPGNQQTADQVSDYREVGDKGSAGLFFDPTAFAQPQGVRFGETGRTSPRPGRVEPGLLGLPWLPSRWLAPGGVQGRGLQRYELARWRSPLGTNTTTDTGGTISVTDANFGRNFNVYGERQIRLGLRFSF